MGFRFQRRIRVAPGISLNFSKSGVSTSFGVRGARVTVGRRGTYANIGLPGTGISYRTRIDGGGGRQAPSRRPAQTPPPDRLSHLAATPRRLPAGAPRPSGLSPDTLPYRAGTVGFTLVQSALIRQLGSEALEGIRTDILTGRNQRAAIVTEQQALNKRRAWYKRLKLAAQLTLLYWLARPIGEGLRARASALDEAQAALDNRHRASLHELHVNMTPAATRAWEGLAGAFERAARSERIQDFVAHRAVDRQATRSSFASEFEGRPVTFDRRPLADLACPVAPLRLGNANGGDVLLYPTFLVIDGGPGDIALIDYEDLTAVCEPWRVIEQRRVPADALVVDYAWQYANKDGGPDRRFRENEQYPVTRAGCLSLSTSTGLNERYLISHYEATDALADALKLYRAYVVRRATKEEV